MLQIPIFSKREDPEAVAQVVKLALDFRFTFKRDVVIDMYAYRRLGHNEGMSIVHAAGALPCHRTTQARREVIGSSVEAQGHQA